MINKILLEVLLILLYIYMHTKVRHGVHMLQLEYYKNDRYNNWINKNKKVVFSLRDILMFIATIVTILNVKAGLIFSIFIALLLLLARNIFKEKKPLVITGRVKRIFTVETLIYLVVAVLANINILFVILANILVVLAYYLVIVVNGLNQPIEKMIQEKFVRKAKKTLKQMDNLKIIGITGSYGKTSTKYIVSTILSQKYNILKTPKSFNTKMGIVRTINENLKPTDQIFVCEMGADEVGEIKELCDLVHPDIGMITSIGPQHLETFGSLENIKKTKFELVDSLSDKGVAFLNYDDENVKTVETNKNKITYGVSKDNSYYAKDINIGEFGSEFNIYTKNGEEIYVKTKLLGEHNIINIVGAVAIAKELGLTNEQIKLGIKLLKPVEHRLELKQHANGTIIIDDAYNSNTKGAQMAVEVLGRFKTRKRILITPGIVELGDKLYEYNKIFGKQAAKNCDYVILVGEKQAKPIYEGLLEEKFDKEKIYIVKNFEEAKGIMNNLMDSNTVILLENDLTDNYL